MTKWVYSFGAGKAEGNATMRALLGGKGANLAEMSKIGLPVPSGLTITTEACAYYYRSESSFPTGLEKQVALALREVEESLGRRFGDPDNPLLVSVRSGARASMPGMMDTVLNLGLNDVTVEGLARTSGDRRFAYDSYRRFIQMYGSVVLGIEHHDFEEQLERLKRECGVNLDIQLGAAELMTLVAIYKDLVQRELGTPFPEAPLDQLWGATGAVFRSWNNERAIVYRRLHSIPDDWGTAVTIQAMVFGNMGDDCATGVAFTRNPSTGENSFYGEYLVNAQGEDVVAGLRTPQSLTIEAKDAAGSQLPAMEELMPQAYAQLLNVRDLLERHYRDVQDLEFTIEKGRLYMLQTRSAKRTAAAAIRIAVEMAKEGFISKADAVNRIDPSSLDQLLHPTPDPNAPRTLLTRGLPASPGAVCGVAAFSAKEAEARAKLGQQVILVRIETSPEDIHGMHAARGILTTRGGMTSHAAVIARGMGRSCVTGAGNLKLDYGAGTLSINGYVVKEGDTITIDGSTGEVFLGAVATMLPELSEEFQTLMRWADRFRRIGVRANADTPADAVTARQFGAEGIGLCRTEHMFFDADRIVAVREMIVADSEKGRRQALAKLLPMQRQDFVELFTVMDGLPVTIRLLDPPLHEFLPRSEAEMQDVAASAGTTLARVQETTARLAETNPMLGHRGCRLGITFPEVYEMQARAIFEAVAVIKETTGRTVRPEVMIPLAATRRELDILKEVIDQVAGEVELQSGIELSYTIGTMIELPRAALRAREIAEAVEFFSFGTNDLTQTCLGLSRDDSDKFLEIYQRKGIFAVDPFVSIDVDGVGELLRIAMERGRQGRRDLKTGLCGEHGGDPASVRFCEEIGLDYVSCSPYRVPIARLAGAQAAFKVAQRPAAEIRRAAAMIGEALPAA